MRMTSGFVSLRARLAGEDGFSMLAVIMVMIAAAMFVAAGYAAANGDLPVSRNSQDRKAAYAAAESGINFYRFRLDSDNDYWTKCTTVPGAPGLSPVNQETVAAAQRKWRNVPGSSAEYTIDLVPANGYSACAVGVNDSMIDRASRTFRIRATGRPSSTSNLRRTVNATFRRKSFLDFLYFTDYETVDPAAYPAAATSRSQSSTWAKDNCADKRRTVRPKSGPAPSGRGCEEIQFADFDDLLACGNPQFGRQDPGTDKIEVSLPGPGHKQNAGCAGTPVFNGPFQHSTEKMTMPPSNDELKNMALPGYLFEGKTTIRFNATGNMTVVNPYLNGGAATNMGLPSNGVIYVRNGTCTGTVSPIQASYDDDDGCAQVYVSGTYTANVTVGSQNDIIVRAAQGTNNGDLVRANDSVVMGLVANNYVRVAHPVDSNCQNVTAGAHQAMPSVRIDAAILSLQHSFVVDNWQCGAKLGKLTVNGAIAQKYRGAVGSTERINGVTYVHGYEKDYNYDDRLKVRSPPYFLDPVASAWGVIRTNEQVPAAAQ
jgi:hypothetical protein